MSTNLIYNGGLIDANAKIKEAQTKTLQQTAVNLYSTQIKSAVLLDLSTRASYYFDIKQEQLDA
jgi:hypothetical protein